MKRISIQDLKAKLSAAIGEAESGHTIVVTRHNQPVAKLGPPGPQHINAGKDLGKRGIRPAVRLGRSIPYLEFLRQDRGDQ